MGLYFADVERDVLEGLHGGFADLDRGDRGSAGDHDVEPDDVGEAVVQRQDDQRAVMRRDVDARERLLDIGRVVPVREYDALRVGRGPGGVGDRGIVFVPNGLPDLQKLLLVLREVVASEAPEGSVGGFTRFEGRSARLYDVFDLREFGADAADLRQLVLRDEECLDLGVAQPEQEVVRLFEFHREGYADGSGVEESKFGDDPCVGSFGEDGDLVFGADADGGETCADFEGQLFGFGIGRGLELVVPFFEQEGLSAVLFDGGLEEVDDGFLHGSQSIFNTARNAD